MTGQQSAKQNRVAIYARVSTTDKGQDVGMQLRDLEAYTKARDWTVRDKLSDVNYFFRLTTIRIAGLAGSIYVCSFQVLLIRSSGPRVAHALSRKGDLLGLSRRTGEKSTPAFAPGAPISA